MRLPGGQLHLFRRRHKPETPPAAPEFATCCALADTLRIGASPDWFWCHYPAGEARTAITGARLKRMGTKAGVADYLLCSPDGRLPCPRDEAAAAGGCRSRRRTSRTGATSTACRMWWRARSTRPLPRLRAWGVLAKSGVARNDACARPGAGERSRKPRRWRSA